MPINRWSQRTFHRRLYAGMLQKVTILKRDPDQQQGTVTAYTLYQVRQSMMTKTGQTIQGDMLSDHRCSFHIPISEMIRTGINYFNPIDRVIDFKGRYWQPEAPTTITIKLLEQHWCLDCLRVDPPDVNIDYWKD